MHTIVISIVVDLASFKYGTQEHKVLLLALYNNFNNFYLAETFYWRINHAVHNYYIDDIVIKEF